MSEAIEPTNGNGYGHVPDVQSDPAYRALMAEARALEANILLARQSWARAMGFTFDGARDTYKIFGYDNNISTQQYRAKYQRGGIAGRIVDAMPNATWRGAMELIEDETKDEFTIFEKAWADLDKRLQIQARLLRVDKLSQLSNYACLLLGTRDGNLEKELPKSQNDKSLIYLQPYLGGGNPWGGSVADKAVAAGADMTVFEYDIDPKSPRFGLPKTYQLMRASTTTETFNRFIDWTRIIHVAEGCLDDDVFGLPSLERVWNLIADLEKVTSGGAEAFWLRANQGFLVNVDKDMALAPTADEMTALKQQVEAYKHNLDRWIRTRGVNVDVLGSDVANFSQSADAILTQIAGAKSIPKRILTGSEMGELASSQDRDNWADQVHGRQTQYAGPYIVRQLVDRLIQYGYLPAPKKGPDTYEVTWPHIQTLTETEKSTGAKDWATTNQTMGEPVFTEAEIRDKWYGMAPLSAEQRKEIDDRAAEKMKQQQALMADAPGQKAPPETKPFQKKNDLKAAADHKLSSTQVQLPMELAVALLAFGKGIPEFDRAECEEVGEDWRETDPHVTVKYGLHTNNADDVRAVLPPVPVPIHFTLGRTNFFSADKYDVLYVEVFSPDLVTMNGWLSEHLDNTQTQASYIPHATIAYLKRGLAKRYMADDALLGMSAAVSSIRFSPAEGEPTDIPLAPTSLAFNPDQPRDDRGQWSSGWSRGGTVEPTDESLRKRGFSQSDIDAGRAYRTHLKDVREMQRDQALRYEQVTGVPHPMRDIFAREGDPLGPMSHAPAVQLAKPTQQNLPTDNHYGRIVSHEELDQHPDELAGRAIQNILDLAKDLERDNPNAFGDLMKLFAPKLKGAEVAKGSAAYTALVSEVADAIAANQMNRIAELIGMDVSDA